MMRHVNTDLAAGIIGLALSITFWGLIDPDISRMSIVFPKIMIFIMGSISGLIFIKGLTKAAEYKNLFDVGSNVQVIVTGLFFFGWAIAIGYLGFVVSSVVSMFLVVLYLSMDTRKMDLVKLIYWFGIVTCEVLVFFWVFTHLLYVQFPEGWFF